jgi:hypothetical protein
LYATTIGMKKPATAVLQTPMRASAEAVAADAAPRAAHGANRSGLIWVGTAVGVVALGLGVMYFVKGGGPAAPPANAGVNAPANPVTSAPPPAQTAPAPKTPAAPPAKGASDVAPPAARNSARPAGGGAAGDLLAVSSSPSGARITLNGVDTGKVTPQALSLNSKQPNTIQLSKQGYQPVTATITAADVQAGSREFTLSRQSGPVQLTVTGAFPFDVLQGEKVLGTSQTHHEVTVEPTGGPVTARAKEYLLQFTVPVDYQRPQADVTLPGPGKLTILSKDENCTVSADGVDLGPVPIAAKAVASGSHSVTLKCQDGRTETKKVTVAPGDNKAQVTFEKPKGQ